MSRFALPALSALALAACGGSNGSDTTAELPVNTGTQSAQETPVSEPGDMTADSTPQELSDTSALPAAVMALGPDFADADLVNGRRQYRRCQSCHTLEAGGRHTVGPNLYGVLGAAAAAKEGFNYSDRLRDAGLTWDLATLDAWIENPRGLVPGNRMSFVGLRDADDRRDVIAYIASETAARD